MSQMLIRCRLYSQTQYRFISSVNGWGGQHQSSADLNITILTKNTVSRVQCAAVPWVLCSFTQWCTHTEVFNNLKGKLFKFIFIH